MARETPKRLPLPPPAPRQLALTEPAYESLPALNESYGLGNNYLLTVLPKHPDEIADAEALDRIRRELTAEHGAPDAPTKTTGTAE